MKVLLIGVDGMDPLLVQRSTAMSSPFLSRASGFGGGGLRRRLFRRTPRPLGPRS